MEMALDDHRITDCVATRWWNDLYALGTTTQCDGDQQQYRETHRHTAATGGTSQQSTTADHRTTSTRATTGAATTAAAQQWSIVASRRASLPINEAARTIDTPSRVTMRDAGSATTAITIVYLSSLHRYTAFDSINSSNPLNRSRRA